MTTVPYEKKVAQCRRKFLKHFPKGFYGEKYIAWEREYKWQAHAQWEASLSKERYSQLLADRKYNEIASIAIKIESRTNLLFSFEKMALRDAVKPEAGAAMFARGLYEYVYGEDVLEKRFEQFAGALSQLPVVQTRVHTWPLQTVFGFIANPREHIFLKPRVTQEAAKAYGFEFDYMSRPNWDTYQSLLDFAQRIRKDIYDLKPRDYIDLQSFIWVMGSAEYG
jgi:hypothetical protein